MKNTFKYALGLAVVVAIRLLPHPPNVEPIMATMMPFAKRWGALTGALFAMSSVLIYDVLTGTWGTWTLFTAGAYALVGLGAGWYFSRPNTSGVGHYIGYSIIATLYFDAATGFTAGPLFFHQSLIESVIGQIPFTLYHLVGNITFALVVSPLVERFIVVNRTLETTQYFTKFARISV